jgi:hypothetical protein
VREESTNEVVVVSLLLVNSLSPGLTLTLNLEDGSLLAAIVVVDTGLRDFLISFALKSERKKERRTK